MPSDPTPAVPMDEWFRVLLNRVLNWTPVSSDAPSRQAAGAALWAAVVAYGDRRAEQAVAPFEALARSFCPLANNEGNEQSEAAYICLNEDGDPFIEEETAEGALRAALQCWDRMEERWEAERDGRLQAERALEALRAPTAPSEEVPA